LNKHQNTEWEVMHLISGQRVVKNLNSLAEVLNEYKRTYRVEVIRFANEK